MEQPGPILDQSGAVLGEHRGVAHYTVGQRRGLRLPAAERLYVLRIEAVENRLIVGPRDELQRRTLVASRLNWVAIEPPTEPWRANAKIRSQHAEAEARLVPLGNDHLQVEFDTPQFGVAPGQAVVFPEVRQWMDRLGMLSEQGSATSNTSTPNRFLRAALAVDPKRIFRPISGRFSHSRESLILPDEMWPNVIDDGHPYSGWYGKTAPQSWSFGQTWTPRRLVTLGEFGAEALDAYETMRDHYPPQFQPPPAETDTLWAASQVAKRDVKQIAGLGRKPTNLREYIEASQNYQEAVLADKVIGMRLSPRAIAGYGRHV